MQKRFFVKGHSRKGKLVKGHYRVITNGATATEVTPGTYGGNSITGKPTAAFFRRFFYSKNLFASADTITRTTQEADSDIASEVYYKDSIGVYRGADTIGDGEVLRYVWKPTTGKRKK